MEFMLTLACNWGCKDCCRGLEAVQPRDSDVTPDQARRFITHLEEQDIFVRRLKVHGGEPVLNPDFEEIINLFGEHTETRFGKVKVQTAYPKRAVLAKYNIRWFDRLQLHCEPVDGRNESKQNVKDHHVPWFVSPQDEGLLSPDEPPPEGTALTSRACELQGRCGRSFERWGFTACAQEAVIGRAIGIAPYEDTYKHWGDPAICRHCPMSLGKDGSRELQARANRGEIARVSPSLSALDPTCGQIVQLENVYKSMPETQKPW
jgi:hypothetical protein